MLIYDYQYDYIYIYLYHSISISKLYPDILCMSCFILFHFPRRLGQILIPTSLTHHFRWFN